jgi:hypothetical protein
VGNLTLVLKPGFRIHILQWHRAGIGIEELQACSHGRKVKRDVFLLGASELES